LEGSHHVVFQEISQSTEDDYNIADMLSKNAELMKTLEVSDLHLFVL
jgi:hypothetical protein